MTKEEIKRRFPNKGFQQFLEKELGDGPLCHMLEIQVDLLRAAFDAGRSYASKPPMELVETKPFDGHI